MPDYDPQNLESVLSYMRQRFGMEIFREASRTYAILCDLAPKLKPYGNIMRQLIERGTLSELETASGGDQTQGERVIMKARHALENELFLRPDLVELFSDALRTLYGVAPASAPVAQLQPATPSAPSAQLQPAGTQLQPVPTLPPPVRTSQRGECGARTRYELDASGVLTISGSGPMWDYQWDSDRKNGTSPWWRDSGAITQVLIQDGVTSVGSYAFIGCDELTSVEIPDSVTKIGAGAFLGCNALKSVAFPESVREIDQGAFFHCDGLTSVYIPDSVRTIGEGAFADCGGLTSANVPAAADIPYNAFPRGVRVTKRGGASRNVPAPPQAEPSRPAPPQAQPPRNAPQTGAAIVKRGECGANVRYELDADGVLTISGSGPMRHFPWKEDLAAFQSPWRQEHEDIEHVVICDGVTKIGSGSFSVCVALTSVEIPESVTEISDYAFAGCASLMNVDIPDSVTRIGVGAFALCESLRNVTLPNRLTEIEDSVFDGCSALYNVTIPESVSQIGDKAFADCKNLKSVSLPAGARAADSAFPAGVRLKRRGNAPTKAQPSRPAPAPSQAQPSRNAPAGVRRGECGANVRYTLENGVLTISGVGPMFDFRWDDDRKVSNAPWWSEIGTVQRVSLLDGVSAIGEYAFLGYEGRENIDIPASVTKIGECAFLGCDSLTRVVIPEGLREIDDGAFYNCAGLTEVVIADSVTKIGALAFKGCGALTDVSVPKTTNVAGGAFPPNVRLTRRDARSTPGGTQAPRNVPASPAPTGARRGECGANVRYALENGVLTVSGAGPMFDFRWDDDTKISNAPWWREIASVTRIVIQDGVTALGEFAFLGYEGRAAVSIPGSVAKIGECAFLGCENMTGVTLAEGLREIADGAFYRCSGLTALNIPDSVTQIGALAFKGCVGLTEISVPQAANVAEGAFPPKVRLTRRDPRTRTPSGPPPARNAPLPSSAARIVKRGECGANVRFTLDENGLLIISGFGPMTDFNSAASPWYAERKAVTRALIQNGVTKIGRWAFEDCRNLSSLSIADSVTKIDNFAFYNCSALTSLALPPDLTVLEGFTFKGCSGLTSVLLPDGLKEIRWNAFEGCKGLTSVTIPDSVEEIGDEAFKDCTSLISVSVPAGARFAAGLFKRTFPLGARVTRRR